MSLTNPRSSKASSLDATLSRILGFVLNARLDIGVYDVSFIQACSNVLSYYAFASEDDFRLNSMYAPRETVWLASRHSKTKRNKKLEDKFLGQPRQLPGSLAPLKLQSRKAARHPRPAG